VAFQAVQLEQAGEETVVFQAVRLEQVEEEIAAFPNSVLLGTQPLHLASLFVPVLRSLVETEGLSEMDMR